MQLQFAQLGLELTCRFCNSSSWLYLIHTRCVGDEEFPLIPIAIYSLYFLVVLLRVEVDHGVHVNASSVQKFTFMSYIDQLCKCGLGSRFTFSCAVHLHCQSL